jgi:hypothetical protein
MRAKLVPMQNMETRQTESQKVGLANTCRGTWYMVPSVMKRVKDPRKSIHTNQAIMDPNVQITLTLFRKLIPLGRKYIEE